MKKKHQKNKVYSKKYFHKYFINFKYFFFKTKQKQIKMMSSSIKNHKVSNKNAKA